MTCRRYGSSSTSCKSSVAVKRAKAVENADGGSKQIKVTRLDIPVFDGDGEQINTKPGRAQPRCRTGLSVGKLPRRCNHEAAFRSLSEMTKWVPAFWIYEGIGFTRVSDL